MILVILAIRAGGFVILGLRLMMNNTRKACDLFSKTLFLLLPTAHGGWGVSWRFLPATAGRASSCRKLRSIAAPAWRSYPLARGSDIVEQSLPCDYLPLNFCVYADLWYADGDRWLGYASRGGYGCFRSLA